MPRPSASIQTQIALHVCGLSTTFNDSTVTASEATGPEIIEGFNAYRKLSGINWSSDYVGPLRYPSHLRWLITEVSSMSLVSTDTPLFLNESDSNFNSDPRISVYTGTLELSWTEQYYIIRRWFPIALGSANKSSIITVDNLSMIYRLETNNALLDCYESGDTQGLICVNLSGTLANPMGFNSVIEIECKSYQPLQYSDPVDYISKDATITVC